MDSTKRQPKTEFGRSFKRMLGLKMMKPKQLAARAQIAEQYVYRLLRGDAEPSFDVACRIADALWCRVGELREPPEASECDNCRLNRIVASDHDRTRDYDPR